MTTALYRRYRPETFAEVIGQEHVTAPLMQALRSGRVNHAYLFSGPRGCGKTTSARILARTLNCHRNTPENPIDTPCGECPSCVELARGGSGSLDVVEIDAASHNGVDDARDLRERATFAPARDRYKIFVLDEAHMVTSHGFNALLKIVEEPPPHIKFVFATTEPDKVIGTIRSRTHHYPFRLVPPDVLGPYLDQLCASEGVELGAGVVPLVTRAGGGSVRDTLSVLDQLIAGAAGGVEYDAAVSLLGFTHATLLDDVVDAIAARDGASIFRVVDQIIATGHEPRRFVEDVLERLRDLIVIAVSGEAAGAVLRDLPADQLERMRHQAASLGVAELSRAADLVNAALTEMTGATSPRLHLELLCARLLLPGADDGTDGLAARIDRLERGAVASGSVVPAGASTPVAAGSVPVRDGASAAAASGTGASAPAGSGPGDALGQGGSALTGPAAVRAALQQSRASRGTTSAGSAASATEPFAASATEPVAAPTEPVAAPVEVAQQAPDGAEAEPVPRSPDAADASAASVPGAQPIDSDSEGTSADEQSHDAAPAAAPDAAPPVDRGRRSDQDVADADVAGPSTEDSAGAVPERAAPEQSAPEQAAQGAGGVNAEEVRRRWEEIVANLSSPVTRALVVQNAQVASLTGDQLVLAFQTDGLARNFSQPRHLESFSEALYQTLGLRARIDVTVGVAGPGDAGGNRGGRERADSPAASSAPSGGEPDDPDVAGPEPEDTGQGTGVESAHSDASALSAADADAADAAWLAGEIVGSPDSVGSAAEAFSVDRPASSVAAAEPATTGNAAPPAPAPSPPERAPATAPAVAAPTVAQAPAASATAPSPARLTGREAAMHAARNAQRPTGQAAAAHRGAAPAAPAAPPSATAPESSRADFDEVSDDDPDITSAGLVGVALVVKVLDGTVVEEVTDQP